MNRTICWITARGLIGRRRFLLLLPLPLLLVGLAALAESLGGSDPAGANTVMVGFGMAVVVPLTALIVGTGVLSPEIDDGTLLHVLAKPLSRAEILGSKLAIAGIVSLVTTVPALLASGLILDGVATGLGFAAGGAVTVVAYCAVFIALSVLSRRPVLIGLLYVLLWEGMLVRLLTGTSVLSVQQYGLRIAHDISGTSVVTPHVSLPMAITMSCCAVVSAFVVAVERLRSFSIVGGE